MLLAFLIYNDGIQTIIKMATAYGTELGIGQSALIGAILLVALIFGFAFGGIRIVAKRLFPNRVFDRPEDVEIIRLNLK